jgi:hypothetical protein
MGYIHEAGMSQFVPPLDIGASAGTWAVVRNSNVWTNLRTAADVNFTLYIPVPILSSPVALKGGYLKSIELMIEIATTLADDFTLKLFKDTLAVTGTLNTATEITGITLDVGHDGVGERKAIDEHRLVITLDTPAWIDNDETYHLEVYINPAVGTNIYIFGAIINYTLRT